MSKSDVPQNLTVEEAAAHWRTTRHAIYSQHARGQLPGALARKVGRRFLFNREVVEHFDRTGERLDGR
jgi:hypothetical protein